MAAKTKPSWQVENWHSYNIFLNVMFTKIFKKKQERKRHSIIFIRKLIICQVFALNVCYKSVTTNRKVINLQSNLLENIQLECQN